MFAIFDSVRHRSTAAVLVAILGIVVTGVAGAPAAGQEPEETEETAAPATPDVEEGEQEPAQAPDAEDVDDADVADADDAEEADETDEEEAPPPLTDAERLLLAAREPPRDERLRFEIVFSPEAGGGAGVALAEELELEGSLYILIGRVEFQYQDIVIRAERAEIDQETKMVAALGNIVLDQGPTRITAATLSFHLDEKTGSMTQARGYVANDYFFRGEEVFKTGERHYTVMNGSFSSCAKEVPAWSFKTRRTSIVIDGYARTRNTTMRVKNAPVFYWPYMIWPVKPARSSGFLVPKPGFSGTRGTTLGMAYYQTFGDSFDTTLHYEYSDAGFDSFGNQFRYQPSEGTFGFFEGNWIEDPRTETTRWRATLAHESRDLPWGFVGAAVLEDASDFDYFRDFEREIRNNSRRQLYSFGYLTRNWGRNSMNLILDQRETLLRNGSIATLRQLPEFEYSMRATQLGNTPLYFGLASAAHLLQSEREDVFSITYPRVNLRPNLTVPLRAFPWLSLSVDVGANYTWWGDSLYLPGEAPEGAEGGDAIFRGENLDRLVPSVSAEIVGPSISRIYNAGGKTWSKYKHIVEPRFGYVYVDEYDEFARILTFDEIDVVGGANLGVYSLINRFLAKPADEDLGGAREIMSLALTRFHSFDKDVPLETNSDFTDTSQGGPLALELRYQPNEWTSLRQQVIYSLLHSGIASTSTSGTFGFGPHSLGVRWTTRLDPEFDFTRTNQFRVGGSISLVRDKLVYYNGITYDANADFVQQQNHILQYTGGCYTMTFEFSEWGRLSSPEKENVYRFSLALKNVGTFLDLTGGQHETL